MSSNALPKILIDARMVSKFEHGISKYVSLIAEGLASGALGELPYEPVFILNSSAGVENLAPWNQFSHVLSDVAFLNPHEWFEIPRLIKQTGAVAFHSPSFASFPGLKVPYLQTIHDLIHLDFGSLPQKIYYQVLLKRFARNAHVLATVSYAARKEIADWLNIDEPKIEIHPNVFHPVPVSSEKLAFEARELEEAGLSRRAYFLAIANDKPHKNLKLLKEAYAKSGVVQPMIVAHEFMRKHDPSRISEHLFDALVRNARVLVSPSLTEGFGRVPVEAILYRTPVIMSAIPTHFEIFEGAPHGGFSFVDPADVQAWRSAIELASANSPEPPPLELLDWLLKRYAPMHLLHSVNEAYKELVPSTSKNNGSL